MIKGVFLDLDNTLLVNPDSVFAPGYLRLADPFFAEKWNYPGLSSVILQTIRAMIGKRDMQQTNSDVAIDIIAQATEKTGDAIRAGFDAFYASIYPKLRDCTQPIPFAVKLVKTLQDLKLTVVIATNPLYPAEAIRQRLAWAGLSDDLSAYALVTHAENMHFAKPDPAFYAEALARVGLEPDEVFMVGDNPRNDIEPAQTIGMHTYTVTDAADSEFSGSLEHFLEQAESPDWFDMLPPPPLQAAMIEPEMRGNIGALFGVIASAQPHFWRQHPDPQEWSPIQIVCHLVESEIKVQRPRLERIFAENNPFLPITKPPLSARDAIPCADEGYPVAVHFMTERMITLNWLKQLVPGDWLRPARHSTFGLTTLLEMAQFTAQHDRLHINQLCQTLGQCK
ncbi:MAG: HAD-IA family hydrolase [Chloroflexota bacterium]